MEIALTGSLPLLPQPQRQPPQQPQSQGPADSATSRAQPNSQTGVNRPEKEVTGQVVNDEADTYTESRQESGGANSQAQNFTPVPTRRVSAQASIQTYADNQALVINPSQPRQVSGIIDIRV